MLFCMKGEGAKPSRCPMPNIRANGERTYIVKIDIDPAKVGEDEVAYGIGSLNRLRITIEGGEKPRVFGSN